MNAILNRFFITTNECLLGYWSLMVCHKHEANRNMENTALKLNKNQGDVFVNNWKLSLYNQLFVSDATIQPFSRDTNCFNAFFKVKNGQGEKALYKIGLYFPH